MRYEKSVLSLCYNKLKMFDLSIKLSPYTMTDCAQWKPTKVNQVGVSQGVINWVADIECFSQGDHEVIPEREDRF